MADNVAITPGSGATIASDDVGGVQFQRVKLDVGGDGVSLPVAATASGAPQVNLRNNAGTEVGTSGAPLRTDPTGSTAQPVTDNGSTLSVDDGAGSLTIDAPVGTPAFVRLSDGTNPISTLPVSGGVTAAQGTPAAVGSGWPVKITDGTDTALVSAAGGLNVSVIESVAIDLGQDELAALGTAVVPVAGVYNEAAGDPSAGQAAAVRITQERGLHSNLRNAAGIEIGTDTNAIRTSPSSTAATQPVSGTVTAKLATFAGAAFATTTALPVTLTSRSRTRVTKKASLAASLSAQDLWTPTGGARFIVTKVILAITVAGSLALYGQTNNEANTVLDGTQAIGNREYDFSGDPWVATAINDVLRWTTGTGITGTLTVHGYEE